MDWETLSLSDIRRLVAAIEQAVVNQRACYDPHAVQKIIDRAPLEPLPHGRVTIGMLRQLLEQLNGCTVLPEEVTALLQPQRPAMAEPPSPVIRIGFRTDTLGVATIEYPFPFTYDPAISMETLFQVGDYWYNGPDQRIFNLIRYDIIGPSQTVKAGLVCFDKIDSIRHALDLINQYLPVWQVATLPELLSFGMANPEQLRGLLIVALGSHYTEDNGHHLVPAIDSIGFNSKQLVFLSQIHPLLSNRVKFLVTEQDRPRIRVDPPPVPSAPTARPATFAELVAACHFTSIERGFTEEHFPLVDDGTAKKQLSLPFYLDRNMMSIAPILTVTGGKPVGIKRALEFISSVTYSLEAYMPIAVIGARWGNRIPVVLPGNRLALFDIRGRFRGKWRVLAAF